MTSSAKRMVRTAFVETFVDVVFPVVLSLVLCWFLQ